MRAAAVDGYGGSERLLVRDLPDPGPPGTGQVLVRVRATSINPIDWKMRRGDLRFVLPIRFPFVPGRDIAGEVVAIGPEVVRFQPGDLVFGAVDPRRDGGAAAELVLAREEALAAKPPSLSFAEAAALPIAGLTALQALRDKGELAQGETVLINGASGGVGHFAVQLGKVLGAHVTAVASTPNQGFLHELGADRTLSYQEDDFTTFDEVWDVVFDAAGLTSFRDCEPVLAEDGGVYVTTAARPGIFAWTAITTLGGLFGRRRRARFLFAAPKADDLHFLARLVEQGRLRPVIEQTFPLEKISAAHAASERGHARGKLAVEIG